jgi:predicted RND superfamily exporter protein
VPDDAALLALAPRLERLAAELEGVPHVTATAGPQDLLRMVGLRLAGKPGIPDTLAPLALAPKQTRQEFRKLLGLWVHPQKGLRLTVLTTTPDAESAPRQRTLIRQALRRHFPETPTEVSGHFAMLISTPGTLMDTLVRSLTVTVVLITLAFFVAFRSPVLALGGMAANLMPVLAVLGVMGWLGIKLDVATVMTGSVVYGIAVDDTFHYLYHRHRSGSILRAARIAGQGIVGTTFVVAGGFVVLGLSGFDPVVRFGLLTAFGAGAALGVDALLLPALVGRRFEAGPAG